MTCGCGEPETGPVVGAWVPRRGIQVLPVAVGVTASPFAPSLRLPWLAGWVVPRARGGRQADLAEIFGTD